jgi:UDP-N-acetylglucosamine 2-epimerase (non-hydrolysing)
VKIATILGTRPEIIRLSRIIEKLDRCTNHVLLHTGQNFERGLSDIFFEQLAVRQPDHRLEARAETVAGQIANILTGCEALLRKEKPDRLLVLGDTNSALSAIIAKRMGIPVFHMEAGNRCYDDRVPEELNRRLVDHSSDLLMPYTERSRANLLREGVPGERICVTGNPILEVIEHFRPQIDRSIALQSHGLTAQNFVLVTLHRAENVDVKHRLVNFSKALTLLSERHGWPVIVSTHPRTAAQMSKFGLGGTRGGVRFVEPFGFFDFVKLESSARCVLSDSGTVQEECAILKVPSVTLRDVTERPETLECGSNVLSGSEPESVLACVETVLKLPPDWTPPPEYLVRSVSDTVVRLVTGFNLRISNQGNGAT